MNISNDDRSRWQQWGTTQQDASKAGTIFGPLAGATDIQKIAFEQQQALLRQMGDQRAAEAHLLAKGGWAATGPVGPRTRMQRLVSRVVKAIVLAPIAAALVIVGTGAATIPDTTGVIRESLISGAPDPQFYATTDPHVLEMAGTNTVQLLGANFQTFTADRLEELSEQQRWAVQAMWLRYLKNPKGFLRLTDHQQHLSLVLFDMYLRAQGERTGSAQPYIDRGRLYLSGLDPIYVPYSAQKRRAQSAWFEGALALPDNPELSALASEGSWDEKVYQHFMRGWHVWKGVLPE